MASINKSKARLTRKARIRKNLSGTTATPRMFVFRSNKYMYAGVAVDTDQKVLFSVMSEKGAEKMGELAKKVADGLKKAKVEQVVFDRSGYRYHGNIKAFVDAVRELGIKV